MSSYSYLLNAIRIVESYMAVEGTKMYKSNTPFHRQDFYPKLDDTLLLDPQMIAWYQHLIGILQWGCELARLDMLSDVALMIAFNAALFKDIWMNYFFHI